MTHGPRFAGHWPELAQVANHMLARRVADLPGRVAAGKISQAQADASIALMQATAIIWNAVINRIDIPPITPSWAAITADLATAAERARGRTIPGSPDYAEYVAALHWHSLPFPNAGGAPHIVHIHRCNQQLRAMREVVSQAAATANQIKERLAA